MITKEYEQNRKFIENHKFFCKKWGKEMDLAEKDLQIWRNIFYLTKHFFSFFGFLENFTESQKNSVAGVLID